MCCVAFGKVRPKVKVKDVLFLLPADLATKVISKIFYNQCLSVRCLMNKLHVPYAEIKKSLCSLQHFKQKPFLLIETDLAAGPF